MAAKIFPSNASRLFTLFLGFSGITYITQKGIDYSDLSKRVKALLATLKSADVRMGSQWLSIYSALASGSPGSLLSVSLCLQLTSIPYTSDMLWANWLSGDTLSLIEILKVVAEASPINAAMLLSRAPSIKALSESVLAAGLSRAQLSEIITAACKSQQHKSPLRNIAEFQEQARDDDSPVSPDLTLFFVLTHADSVKRENTMKIIDLVSDAFLADMMRSKQAFISIIEALFPLLTFDEFSRLVPLMLRAMGGNSTPQLVLQTRRVLEQGGRFSIDPSHFFRLFELRLKRPPKEEREILELAADLLKTDAKLKIPPLVEAELLGKVLSSPAPLRKTLLRLLSLGASRSVSPAESLLSSVPALEALVGLSDYESSQRKRLLEETFSRPIDDSELYAFHEDPDHDDVARADQTEESTAQRIAILTEVMRHKIMFEEKSDFKAAPELLLSVFFPLLVRQLKSATTDSEQRQITRALANISTLARGASVEVRNNFLKEAKTALLEINPNMSVYAEAEFRRLKHNVRCIPVTSAPMLIDSILPLSSYTPPDAQVDLVFVHGLRGGLHSWRYLNQPQQGPFETWPEACIAPSFPKLRLLAFNYEAPLWYATHKQHYSEVDVKRNFEEISLGLRAALFDAGVGRNGKKIVFVSFSMGGLVTKQALIADPVLRENTLGIVFLATPHLGSPIADYAYYSPLGGIVSPFVADLSRKSKQVVSLHESFMHLCSHIPTLSVCETAPSDLGAGIKSFVVPLDSCAACKSANGLVVAAGEGTDHEAVSKIRPDLGPHDPRVTALLEFLNRVTN